MPVDSSETTPPPTLDYARPAPLRAGTRMHKIIVGLLLIVGAQMWLLFAGRGGAYWGRNAQIGLIAIIAALSIVPAINRGVAMLLDRFAHPSRAHLAAIAVCVAIVSVGYLYFDACYQQRTFTPKYHDEFSYIIQTRMLAHGRLWQPAHPCAEFFDSFQLIASPVYASIYFPGAALMYVPGVWLHLPVWMMPLLLAGAVVGLLFRIVAELMDLWSGIIAALLVIANFLFRLEALKVMSQIPSMLLMLLMFFAWLRWRERHALKWAALIGVCFGWSAITRPLDALVAAIPIGLVMMIEGTARLLPSRESPATRGSPGGSPSQSSAVITAVLCAMPFLWLQATFNHAVTGSYFHTPFNYYADKYFPQTSFGFHKFDPDIRPQSDLPQKQAYYDQVALPQVKAHTPRELIFNWGDSRLRQAIVANVPTWLTMILMPAGLLAIVMDRRKLVLWATLPLFVLLYAFYTFWLAHYPLACTAAVVLNLVAGAQVIAQTWPRARRVLATFLTVALIALSISELPELDRVQRDEWFDAPQLARIDTALAHLPHKPALVLFKYAGDVNPEEEPVYNTDTTYPDDADIIRAQDLGDARDIKLFNYYATRRPDVAVYRYDRSNDSLNFLGNVRDLASRPL